MFATKSFLELGDDQCGNLKFVNFKIDSFKIRKNSWILRNFKIRKIRILNLCPQPLFNLALDNVNWLQNETKARSLKTERYVD